MRGNSSLYVDSFYFGIRTVAAFQYFIFFITGVDLFQHERIFQAGVEAFHEQIDLHGSQRGVVINGRAVNA